MTLISWWELQCRYARLWSMWVAAPRLRWGVRHVASDRVVALCASPQAARRLASGRRAPGREAVEIDPQWLRAQLVAQAQNVIATGLVAWPDAEPQASELLVAAGEAYAVTVPARRRPRRAPGGSAAQVGAPRGGLERAL